MKGWIDAYLNQDVPKAQEGTKQEKNKKLEKFNPSKLPMSFQLMSKTIPKQQSDKFENFYNRLVDMYNMRSNGKETQAELDLKKRMATYRNYEYPTNALELLKFVNDVDAGINDPNWKPEKLQQSPNPLRKALVSKYYGLPYDEKEIIPSKYQPTVKDTLGLQNYDFGDKYQKGIKNLLTDNFYEDYYSQYKKPQVVRYPQPLNELKDFTLGANKDKEGRYRSYYDSWDIDPAKLKGSGIDLNIFNHPFDIYGRLYENEIPYQKRVPMGKNFMDEDIKGADARKRATNNIKEMMNVAKQKNIPFEIPRFVNYPDTTNINKELKPYAKKYVENLLTDLEKYLQYKDSTTPKYKKKQSGGSLNKYEDGGQLGYTTEGRDYSPAWGGQFKDGGTEKKKKGNAYVFAEAPWINEEHTKKDSTFIKEAREIDKFNKRTGTYNNVNIIPTYEGNFEDYKNNIAKADLLDDVYLLGHAGSVFFGNEMDSITRPLRSSKYKNCYLGTCGGSDIIKDYYGNTRNIHGTTEDKWLGINSKGNNPLEMMYSKVQDGPGEVVPDGRGNISIKFPKVKIGTPQYKLFNPSYKEGGEITNIFNVGNNIAQDGKKVDKDYPFVLKDDKLYLTSNKKTFSNTNIDPIEYYTNWLTARKDVLQKNINTYNTSVRENMKEYHENYLKDTDLISVSPDELINSTVDRLRSTAVVPYRLGDDAGFYVPGGKGTAFVKYKKGTDELPAETLFHEIKHAVDSNRKNKFYYMMRENLEPFSNKLEGRELPKYIKDNFGYFSSPDEISARLAIFRINYLEPNKEYNINDITRFLQDARSKKIWNINQLNDMFTPEEILEMHKTIVENKQKPTKNILSSSEIPIVQNGGIIKVDERNWFQRMNDWLPKSMEDGGEIPEDKKNLSLIKESNKIWSKSVKGKHHNIYKTNPDIRKYGIEYYNNPEVLKKLWNNYNFPNTIPYNENDAKKLSGNIQQNITKTREFLNVKPLFDEKGVIAQYIGAVKAFPSIFYNKNQPLEFRKNAVPHELLGHASSGYDYNSNKMNNILENSIIDKTDSSLNIEDFNYYSDPEELYAAIKDAQYKILEKKGFPKNYNFTEDDINEYLGGENKRSGRFFGIIKPEIRSQKVKELLNEIVQNNQPSILPNSSTENNYFPISQVANGGYINKYGDGGNVQMKDQEQNLKMLTDFGNYNKKMKAGGWISKYIN